MDLNKKCVKIKKMIKPKIFILNLKLDSTALFYFEYIKRNYTITQQANAFLNSTAKTLKKGMKYFQSYQ